MFDHLPSGLAAWRDPCPAWSNNGPPANAAVAYGAPSAARPAASSGAPSPDWIGAEAAAVMTATGRAASPDSASTGRSRASQTKQQSAVVNFKLSNMCPQVHLMVTLQFIVGRKWIVSSWIMYYFWLLWQHFEGWWLQIKVILLIWKNDFKDLRHFYCHYCIKIWKIRIDKDSCSEVYKPTEF